MCEDSMEQRYVLCLRCDDADRSLFMLGFSSKLQNASMELLLCKFVAPTSASIQVATTNRASYDFHSV
jgi:hypothetical protein